MVMQKNKAEFVYESSGGKNPLNEEENVF